MAIYSEFSHEKWWFSIVMLNYQRVLTVWSPYFTVFGVLFPTCSCFRPPSASLSSLWAPTDYARTSGQGGNHSKYIFLAHTQYVYVYSIKRFCNHPVNGFCHGSTALDPPEKKLLWCPLGGLPRQATRGFLVEGWDNSTNDTNLY